MNNFVFVDTLNHLTCGLGQLTESLQGCKDHPYSLLRQSKLCQNPMNGKFSEQRLKYLLQKAAYPYELCRSVAEMEQYTSFPPRESFYSSLVDGINISQEDYDMSKKIFDEFQVPNLREFVEMYCLLDTILLAEVSAEVDYHVIESLYCTYTYIVRYSNGLEGKSWIHSTWILYIILDSHNYRLIAVC